MIKRTPMKHHATRNIKKKFSINSASKIFVGNSSIKYQSPAPASNTNEMDNLIFNTFPTKRQSN